MSASHRILSDTLRTTLATFVMQGLAFAVSLFIARSFGISAGTDMFYLVLAIPAFITAAFFGLLKAVFIPIFSEYEGTPEERPLLASLYGWVLLSTLLILFLLYLFRFQLVPMFVPGEGHDAFPEAIKLFVELLPLIVLSSFVGLLGTVYNAYQRFVFPVIIPIVKTATLVLFIVAERGTLSIHTLSRGTVWGEVVQVVCMVLYFAYLRYPLALSLTIHPGLRRMVRLSLPPLASNFILEFNPLVDKIMIASTLVGSVTALNYASKLNDIPLMLLGTGGFLSILLSHWSKLKVHSGREAVVHSFEQALTMVGFVLVPMMVIFFALRLPIIQLLYQGDKFTADAAATTSVLWGILLWSVFPLLVGRVITRVYHVFQDTVTPLYIGFSRVVLNVLLNYLFRWQWGMVGIAVSSTLTAFLLTGVNLVVIRRRFPEFSLGVVLKRYLLISFCGFVSLSLMLVGDAVIPRFHHSFVGEAARLASLSVMGLLSYGAVAYVLAVPDLFSLFRALSAQATRTVPR